MKVENLNKMVKGWFIGDFEPSLFKTQDVEVAIKKYKCGDKEQAHYHKIATEYTVVLNGRIRMFNREFTEGQIVVAEPEEITDFLCMEDSTTVVIKIPGAKNDKYICE